MNYKVYLEWRPERHAYLFLLERENADETRDHIRLVPERIKRHSVIEDDKIDWLEDYEAKELMLAFVSEARKHGIRPPLDAADTEALRKHLEDMRALVFAREQIERYDD